MGFLDGFLGFVLAVLYSYHVFIKYLMLYKANTPLTGRDGVDS
jgi:hypothetical protein